MSDSEENELGMRQRLNGSPLTKRHSNGYMDDESESLQNYSTSTEKARDHRTNQFVSALSPPNTFKAFEIRAQAGDTTKYLIICLLSTLLLCLWTLRDSFSCSGGND